ncbi:MAG: ABC transporter permease subunit, partial [Armatimonadota bacterium]
LYIVLCIGATTMVYPFLLMLGTSITSETDYTEYRPIPRFLYDNAPLFSKEAEIRYSADLIHINERYGTDYPNLQSITPPQHWPANAAKTAALQTWNNTASALQGQVRGMKPEAMPLVDVESSVIKAQLRDWREFKKTLPVRFIQAGYAGRPAAPSSSPSRLLGIYRVDLEKRYRTIDKLNIAYEEENETFSNVLMPTERESSREWNLGSSTKLQEWKSFKERMPDRFRMAVQTDPMFQSFLRQNKYDDSIDSLNKAWGTSYGYFTDIHLSEEMPAKSAQKADWQEFVRQKLPFRYMLVDQTATPTWRAFLKGRYGSISEVSKLHKRPYRSFESIQLSSSLPAEGLLLTDWMDFISASAPISALHPDGTENRYRSWLKQKYQTPAKLNVVYGTAYGSLAEIEPPFLLEDWDYTLKHAGELRRYFALANFSFVWDYIGRHGHAVSNTFLYVTLAILTHLIINPLCAYSLSRYNLRYGHRVLLFLLATMAFPAEVAMIPSFLLLKQFHLLNTFAALILPGMASGYSIFLLKGFFDSLPRELYEAGIIDGASEATMFWRITVPLSKPVLAVIALSSFTVAYGNFLFALIVCQDPNMWTIMV